MMDWMTARERTFVRECRASHPHIPVIDDSANDESNGAPVAAGACALEEFSTWIVIWSFLPTAQIMDTPTWLRRAAPGKDEATPLAWVLLPRRCVIDWSSGREPNGAWAATSAR
jgi:hypothetical protein